MYIYVNMNVCKYGSLYGNNVRCQKVKQNVINLFNCNGNILRETK